MAFCYMSNVRCWLDERVDLCLSMELSPGSSFHGILPHPTFKNYFFIWTSFLWWCVWFILCPLAYLLVVCFVSIPACTFALLFLIGRVLIHTWWGSVGDRTTGHFGSSSRQRSVTSALMSCVEGDCS